VCALPVSVFAKEGPRYIEQKADRVISLDLNIRPIGSDDPKHYPAVVADQHDAYLHPSKRRLGIETARLRTGRAVKHRLCELGQTLHAVMDSVKGHKMRGEDVVKVSGVDNAARFILTWIEHGSPGLSATDLPWSPPTPGLRGQERQHRVAAGAAATGAREPSQVPYDFWLALPASLPQCLDEEIRILCVSKRIGLVHIVSVEVWLMAQEPLQLQPRLIHSA
jgi:hypothetical protein